MTKSQKFAKALEAFEAYKKMLDKALEEGKMTKECHDRWIEKKAKQFDL